MADKVVLTVGTKRGLFLLESPRRRARWTVKGPFLKGWSINYAMIDTRGKPRLHGAGTNTTFASSTFSGDITGEKLQGTVPPTPPKLTPKQEKTAKQWGIDVTPRTWLIAPGPEKKKRTLYAGTAPAGLFRSTDLGKSWEPIDGINKHETRKNWMPGAGGMCLHSFQVDPFDDKRMYAAISAAGAFRSDDAGETWEPINSCVAEYVGAPHESTVGT